MFQYATRRMGGTNRWWRRRRLAASTRTPRGVSDPSSLGALVPADDPPAVFTPAEDAEVAEGHSSQRTIEATYNRKLSKRLSAPRPGMRRSSSGARSTSCTWPTRVHETAHTAAPRRAGARQAMRDHGRHLPRSVRVLFVLVLAAVDVVAYRAAVEVAFDTSDEWPAIIDSYLLSLLSLGMVMAAMFAGRAAQDAAHVARPSGSSSPSWPTTTSATRPAGLVAGRACRRSSLRSRCSSPAPRCASTPSPFRPAGSGSPFPRSRRRPRSGRSSSSTSGRTRRSTSGTTSSARVRRGPSAGCVGPTGSSPRARASYRRREAEITQMWSLYEPSWRVQLEMAAARIAAARADAPRAVPPARTLGRRVGARTHRPRARHGATRESALRHLGLTVDQVLDRAAATHADAAAAGPTSEPDRRPLLAPPPAPSLAPPTGRRADARRHGRAAAAVGRSTQRPRSSGHAPPSRPRTRSHADDPPVRRGRCVRRRRAGSARRAVAGRCCCSVPLAGLGRPAARSTTSRRPRLRRRRRRRRRTRRSCRSRPRPASGPPGPGAGWS